MRALSRHSPLHATSNPQASADLRCPRCGNERSWTLARGRRRCARCRFDWTPGRLPLRLTEHQWVALLRWFVRGLSSAQIAQETGIERKRVLRALTLARQAIAGAFPSRARTAGRPAGSSARPVIGIAIVQGQARAEVVPERDAEAFRRIIRAREGSGSARSPRGRYDAVVYRGRFYRMRAPARGSTPRRVIGELEAFWAFLRQRLRGKGGIRQERLGLYLAEYVWRYNRRSRAPTELVNELLALLRATAQGRQRDFPHTSELH